MKKIYLLLIMLLPIIVFAEGISIEIKSILLEEKSGNIEIVEPAKVDNNSISLNIKFYDVNDYAKYKLVIKNISGKKIKLENMTSNIESKYIEYEVNIDDKEIDKNEEKEVILTLRYLNIVDRENIKSGKYVENQKLNIDIFNNELIIDNGDKIIDNASKNPLTSDNLYFFILIIIIAILLIVLFGNKKITKYILPILVIIPITIISAEKEYEILINSTVEVKLVKTNPCTYDGELVNNSKYQKEQYEYIYSEELDGWRLSLIDRNSTDPVTSKICTEVNEKPIVSMNETFASSKAESIDLSSFDTSNVVDMTSMFYNMSNISSLDLITFDTRKVKMMNAMFYNTKEIESLDLHGFETPSLEQIAVAFYGLNKIKDLDLSNFDTGKVVTMQSMFNDMSSLEKLNLSNWDFRKINYDNSLSDSIIGSAKNNLKSFILDNTKYSANMGSAFANLSSLEEISFKNVDTTGVVNMDNLFNWSQNINELDLSSFDTSNVENMSYMFVGLNKIKKLDLSNFDISKAGNNIYSMFSNMNSLEELDLSNWNFINYANTYLFLNLFGGFANNSVKKVDLENAVFPVNCHDMFYGITKLEQLNLKNVDTSRTTNMSYMFNISNDNKIEVLDLSSFDTSNVTNMQYMFRDVPLLKELDLSNFDTSNLEYMWGMFEGLRSLEKLNLSGFDLSNFKDVNMGIIPINVKEIVTPKNLDIGSSGIDLYNRMYAKGDNVGINRITKDTLTNTIYKDHIWD